ncbi:hypothetical protein ONR57_01860 [Hoyosella sp. YIM 151337]|uniref:hypothetical protein n=1 Tax=Hoyosella sp. YIM 151337 TaxID=2992742 RepID=UPI0022364638|nr:hypothetical protein [Hoyosella sp. YIM 151337]MCW4352041.1 hypothetical protein [Hoyosella sp. YIM 151337]
MQTRTGGTSTSMRRALTCTAALTTPGSPWQGPHPDSTPTSRPELNPLTLATIQPTDLVSVSSVAEKSTSLNWTSQGSGMSLEGTNRIASRIKPIRAERDSHFENPPADNKRLTPGREVSDFLQ